MSWFTLTRIDETAFVTLGADMGSFGVGPEHFSAALGRTRKVELRIDSNGGDSTCGLEMFRLLRTLDTEVLIAGRCWSSAVTVAMAGKLVRIERGSKILVHPPVTHICGTVRELRAEADVLEGILAEVRGVIAERTRQPAQVVDEWLSKDTWFDAEQAVAVGLADEVVDPPPPPPRVRAQTGPLAVASKEPTEQENLFRIFLTAFGDLAVTDKAAFARHLGEWVQTKVREGR
jgi:ATP-dependent protease ClpP protease subunit